MNRSLEQLQQRFAIAAALAAQADQQLKIYADTAQAMEHAGNYPTGLHEQTTRKRELWRGIRDCCVMEREQLRSKLQCRHITAGPISLSPHGIPRVFFTDNASGHHSLSYPQVAA